MRAQEQRGNIREWLDPAVNIKCLLVDMVYICFLTSQGAVAIYKEFSKPQYTTMGARQSEIHQQSDCRVLFLYGK